MYASLSCVRSRGNIFAAVNCLGCVVNAGRRSNLQPLLSAIESSQIFALVTGQESRYEAMHAPAPTFPKIAHTRSNFDASLSRRAILVHHSGSPAAGPQMSRNFVVPRGVADPLATQARSRARSVCKAAELRGSRHAYRASPRPSFAGERRRVIGQTTYLYAVKQRWRTAGATGCTGIATFNGSTLRCDRCRGGHLLVAGRVEPPAAASPAASA